MIARRPCGAAGRTGSHGLGGAWRSTGRSLYRRNISSSLATFPLITLSEDEVVLCLEPISKSSEEDDKAGELNEAEKVASVIFPADEDAPLPLYPGEEALDQPTSHVTA